MTARPTRAHVVQLPTPDASTATLGGKGVNLQRLLEQRLSVPPTFVVTADAYREHTTAPAIRAAIATALSVPPRDRPRLLEAARSAIVAATVDPSLARRIDAIVQELGPTPLAVRSSATCEDGVAHSFAGQHDTFLGVSGLDACCLAVRRCWASLWTEHALTYRERVGLDLQGVAMAVILQPCIAAEVAGVLFTCDPVDGRTDRVVIEATYGLGETLVGGRVAPDRIVIERPSLAIIERTAGSKSVALFLDGHAGIRKESVAPEQADLLCLADNVAQRLAAIGVRVEDGFGAPQDIEWAVVEGRVTLLQTRPVTSTDGGPATTDRRSPASFVWSNINASELLPDVATPMTFATIERYVDALVRPLMRRFAIDVGGLPIIGLVAGRVYFCVTTFAAVLRRLPGRGRRNLVDLFGGDREQLALAEPALAAGSLPVVDVRGWRTLLRLPGALVWLARGLGTGTRNHHLFAAMRQRTAELSGLDLAAVPDEVLVARVPGIADDLFASSGGLADAVSGMACATYLSALCRRWLADRDGSLANRLLSGIGGLDSAEAGLALWRLAAAGRSTDVMSVLKQGHPFAATRAALSASDDGRAWLAHWDAFMAEHGHHTRGEVDVALPRWREEADYVLHLVRGYLDTPEAHSPVALHRRRAEERAALTAQCERLLSDPVRRGLFRFVLARAQRGVALRETAKSEIVRRIAIARGLLLELGRRYAQRGAFAERDDVFFLTLSELTAVVAGEGVSDTRGLIARRRAEHRDNQHVTPPPVVIGSFDRRRHVRAADPAAAGSGSVLHGLAVSPGVTVGPARVILRADTAEHVLPGEILIAPFTDPGWTPYFLQAAGIVMDLGGALSHGSVVAREYGLPAVVNVGPATRLIRTGQLVRVDGFRGEVTLLDSPT